MTIDLTGIYDIVPNAKYNWKYSSQNSKRVCCVKGCGELGHDITSASKREQGIIVRRPLCHDHYYDSLAKRKGLKNSRAFFNSYHPYRQYRKNYCENIDGRLGYKCTTTIVWEGQLDVDHINGIPTDNRPKNLQTLCSCCHVYKTNISKDYATPGRKTLRMRKKKK